MYAVATPSCAIHVTNASRYTVVEEDAVAETLDVHTLNHGNRLAGEPVAENMNAGPPG